jgi:hypothetical protein
MKKVIFIALLSFPLSSIADHLAVIQKKLGADCSVEEYVAIIQDFNAQWGKDYGYEAELAVPLQGEDLGSLYWVGRSANAEAFGKAWDAWRDAQSDSTSLAAKLQARFNACGELNEARHSYDTYK